MKSFTYDVSNSSLKLKFIINQVFNWDSSESINLAYLESWSDWYTTSLKEHFPLNK